MNDERLNAIRKICEIVGFVALLLYIVAFFYGEDYLMIYKVFFSFIGTIAFSIKTGIEIAMYENYVFSVIMIFISVFYGSVSLIPIV
jgi:hypothetical protein